MSHEAQAASSPSPLSKCAPLCHVSRRTRSKRCLSPNDSRAFESRSLTQLDCRRWILKRLEEAAPPPGRASPSRDQVLPPSARRSCIPVDQAPRSPRPQQGSVDVTGASGGSRSNPLGLHSRRSATGPRSPARASRQPRSRTERSRRRLPVRLPHRVLDRSQTQHRIHERSGVLQEHPRRHPLHPGCETDLEHRVHSWPPRESRLRHVQEHRVTKQLTQRSRCTADSATTH
jgi:hypothetical protein